VAGDGWRWWLELLLAAKSAVEQELGWKDADSLLDRKEVPPVAAVRQR